MAQLPESVDQRLLNDAKDFTSQRWQPTNGADKDLVEVQKRVRPCWQEDAFGAIALTVRYGAQPIEFEKGKCSVVVPAKDSMSKRSIR